METPRRISIETLLNILSALDGATNALATTPGEKAWDAYLATVKAQSELRNAIGLLEPLEIAEMKTASPLKLAA